MNKLLAIYGCLLLSSLSIADQQVSTVANSAEKVVLAKSNLETSFTALNISVANNDDAPLYVMHFEAKKPISLSLKEIEFIEEEDMELGFDTEDYLPENFNPKKVYFDLNSISYVEEEIDTDLGFDSSAYLPENFNPYATPINVSSINYIELEDMKLGFETSEYLPEGFDPYEVYFDVNSISFIENQYEYQLDFDSSAYLPVDFDPYSVGMSVSAINYIENDKIDLGVDTTQYLPENFDPYKVSN
ncbi:MAG: hypothetical protein HKP38_09115 [Croceitalea sp.]|nr:hypothetical protein [Croceitalea sp.]